MSLQGGISNEKEKSILNLLRSRQLPKFKYRFLGEEIDLFFPNYDLYLYLNKEESKIFKEIFLNKREINKVVKKFQECKIKNLLKELLIQFK